MDDTSWHVMEVPHFWTPTVTWLHAEMGFPNLEGLSRTKGISDRLYERELEFSEAITQITSSPSFKLGRALTWPARVLRNLLK